MADKKLAFTVKDTLELNLSLIPFVLGGGLFIPTKELFSLGDKVQVELLIEQKNEFIQIEGKVVWITPSNALHHVLQGIGIQFVGSNAKSVYSKIEENLSKGMDVGGYTYGITETKSNVKMN